MITVAILINNQVIFAKGAVRIDGKPGEMCTYSIYDGPILQHHYDDGAIELCKKILDATKDQLPSIEQREQDRQQRIRDMVSQRLQEIRKEK